MKFHKNIALAIIRSLEEIFIEQRYADKVIEHTLKQNTKWGARDRRMIAETTYEIVRWYRWLKDISGAEENDFWTLLGCWLLETKQELPEWHEFRKVNGKKAGEQAGKLEKVRKIRESIPDWLDELGASQLGSRWDVELSALNRQAEVVLRINTLKNTREQLAGKFAERDIEVVPLNDFPDALLLPKRQNVFRTDLFKEGFFEVQDAASQLVAPFLEPEAGMRIIDACAGGGGKALHLSALMKNKGKVIALDVEQWKLDETKKRARRAGAFNVETKCIDSTKVIKQLKGSADRLLLDVPCSGLGVLRRNPDAKWKLSPEFISRVKESQQAILNDYSSMLKPGGRMVYSTCSILPSENTQQIESFLEQNKNFKMIREQTIFPSEGFDGFYMCAMERKE